MSDPMADIMNVQGYAGLVGPNPYLQFTGQIPIAGYQGPATNAQGQVIPSYASWQASQPPPGTTLNSAPAAAPQYAQPAPSLKQQYLPWNESDLAAALLGGGGMGGQNTASDPQTQNLVQFYQNTGLRNYGGQQPQQAAASSGDATGQRQAYLSALANPGPLQSYGANPPQPGQMRTGSAQQPSVLGAFLGAHPGGGTTGAGGYSNANFFNTLRQLGG